MLKDGSRLEFSNPRPAEKRPLNIFYPLPAVSGELFQVFNDAYVPHASEEVNLRISFLSISVWKNWR